jgi:hypothetical protein
MKFDHGAAGSGAEGAMECGSLLPPFLQIKNEGASKLAHSKSFASDKINAELEGTPALPAHHEEKEMKIQAGLFALGIFLASFLAAFAAAQNAKITVMNPRGIQPLIRRIPMANRPATLDGKTIYVVDTKYPRTRDFVEELFNVLREKFPKTNWVLRDKFGGYVDDDPKLWAEIKEKGNGMIMAVGH